MIPVPAAIVSALFMVAVPVIVLATIWGLLTIMRLAFPERPLPFDGPSRRALYREKGFSVPVGAREIRADVLRRAQSLALPYVYVPGHPVPHDGGVPAPWLEDVHERRN